MVRTTSPLTETLYSEAVVLAIEKVSGVPSPAWLPLE